MSLYICYLCENENHCFFEASLRTVLPYAEQIIVIDGGSTDESCKLVEKVCGNKALIVRSDYPHHMLGADGIQRNKYLKHVPDGAWVLVLDPDEVPQDDLSPLLNLTKQDECDVFDIRMEHCFYSLRCWDARLPEHFVPARFFKKNESMSYPETEHNILRGGKKLGQVKDVTIWHFGDAKILAQWRRKYENNLLKSNIHGKEQLREWLQSRALGGYPVKVLNDFSVLPKRVKEDFLL